MTTRADTAKGKLVKTADQVFSGTVADSEPVMIHDSKFRFEVYPNTGADRSSALRT